MGCGTFFIYSLNELFRVGFFFFEGMNSNEFEPLLQQFCQSYLLARLQRGGQQWWFVTKAASKSRPPSQLISKEIAIVVFQPIEGSHSYIFITKYANFK